MGGGHDGTAGVLPEAPVPLVGTVRQSSPTAYPHIEEMLRLLTKDCQVTLELGCGGRQYRACVAGRYYGADIQSGGYGPPDVLADSLQLPFQDETVDLIFFVASLYLMPDTDRVLEECHRVLQKGGQILIFDYASWVHRRLASPNRFSSSKLSGELLRSGFLPRIHWTCVPRKGPRLLREVFRFRIFRVLLYPVSNWVVLSGTKTA